MNDENFSTDRLRLLRLEEVAELTGLSIITLRRSVHEKSASKRLAHHRIGRAIRISEADLAEFLARSRHDGPKTAQRIEKARGSKSRRKPSGENTASSHTCRVPETTTPDNETSSEITRDHLGSTGERSQDR